MKPKTASEFLEIIKQVKQSVLKLSKLELVLRREAKEKKQKVTTPTPDVPQPEIPPVT